MTTRVTPSPVSQSAIANSDRVIVEYVRTSCIRRARGPTPGTRTQHTTSAFPISSAATRAMIS